MPVQDHSNEKSGNIRHQFSIWGNRFDSPHAGSRAAGGSQSGGPQKKGSKGPQGPPPVQPKSEELARVREKTEQIESLVAELKAKHADPVLLNDVEVYAKAGRMLLEFPELFGTQPAIDRSFQVLDQGMERARQLLSGKPEWDTGQKRIEAYRSEIDRTVQPYGVTLPANYDPAKLVRLYVWLHGRQNNTTEAEFIYNFLRPRPPGNAPVADQGQIQVDCFGRINSAGWHWAGEADVFEAIAAVKKRYKIDDKRVVLRGFSMGGEGAWHIALHYPDQFAAAEIGAGTVSRRAQQQPGLEPYQMATLKIWENISEWALNIFNIRWRDTTGSRIGATGVFVARTGTIGKGRLPVRGGQGLFAFCGRSGPVDDVAEHGSRNESTRSAEAGCISEGVGR